MALLFQSFGTAGAAAEKQMAQSSESQLQEFHRWLRAVPGSAKLTQADVRELGKLYLLLTKPEKPGGQI